ncbi:hypothetical protein [Chryseobacterium oranimense]|jgi:hypothetical protein|uniref:VanZ like family protein n=1 Tax=Chryseobacterium oranimense TaxID=421058 RepID=A0A1M5M4S6_9FLAO|nr:hypothetical protein [Chryseobacterium oranimense]CEJ71061.1 hypothetical protein BN1195_03402 [Chryseobacterium oranimense G311]SHG71693.1 hypothetical protein SAMN05421866_1310 [Chryseobacterium oranimense]
MTFNEIKKEIQLEIKTNKKVRSIWYWGLFSMTAVFVLKWIRARHMNLSGVQDFLQGTLPNFFAATGICASLFIFYKLIFFTDTSFTKKLAFSTLFTFFGLAAWEVIQYYMGSPMDIYDILMTISGCVMTAGFIMIVHSDRLQQNR